jgi:hypothetical protein
MAIQYPYIVSRQPAMVFFIYETQGLILSELLPNQISISRYLQHVNMYQLVRYLKENCYKVEGNHYRHDPLTMQNGSCEVLSSVTVQTHAIMSDRRRLPLLGSATE